MKDYIFIQVELKGFLPSVTEEFQEKLKEIGAEEVNRSPEDKSGNDLIEISVIPDCDHSLIFQQIADVMWHHPGQVYVKLSQASSMMVTC